MPLDISSYAAGFPKVNIVWRFFRLPSTMMIKSCLLAVVSSAQSCINFTPFVYFSVLWTLFLRLLAGRSLSRSPGRRRVSRSYTPARSPSHKRYGYSNRSVLLLYLPVQCSEWTDRILRSCNLKITMVSALLLISMRVSFLTAARGISKSRYKISYGAQTFLLLTCVVLQLCNERRESKKLRMEAPDAHLSDVSGDHYGGDNGKHMEDNKVRSSAVSPSPSPRDTLQEQVLFLAKEALAFLHSMNVRTPFWW